MEPTIVKIDNVEYSDEYIKKMTTEGMFDGASGNDPEFKDCKFYMEAYYQAKRR